MSLETYGRAGPEAFAQLHEIAEYAAGIESVSRMLFMENAMMDLSYHPVPGVCQAVRSLDATAGVDGRQGSPAHTAGAGQWPLNMCENMQLCKCVRGCVRGHKLCMPEMPSRQGQTSPFAAPLTLSPSLLRMQYLPCIRAGGKGGAWDLTLFGTLQAFELCCA